MNDFKKEDFFLFIEVLGIFLSKERFINVLMSILKGIFIVFCFKVILMDGFGFDYDSEDIEILFFKFEVVKFIVEFG